MDHAHALLNTARLRACIHPVCWRSNSLYGLRAMHLVNLCRLKRCGFALNLHAGRLITVRGSGHSEPAQSGSSSSAWNLHAPGAAAARGAAFLDGAAARAGPQSAEMAAAAQASRPFLDTAKTLLPWQRIRLQVGHSSPLRAEYVHATGIAQGHMASCSDLQKRSIIYVPVPGIGAGDAGFEATWECSGS